jgi:hypothetical protein
MWTIHPIFGFWQFGSAWMLLWALAAALPIVIHLWSRRQAREEPWAAMQFLLAAIRKNARRIQLEQWLLLALRTAILLLLALALADPKLSLLAGWDGSNFEGNTHRVLVLDGSYSMGYTRDGQSRFDAAREVARQLVAEGRQGDAYTLVRMSQPPQVVIGQPAFAAADVREEIDNLRLSHGTASLSATLTEVESILRDTQRAHPRLAHHQVVFLTDLQQQTWNDVMTAAGGQRLARVESMASLALIDVGEPGAENLAVMRVEANPALVTTESPVTISAQIQSHARQDSPGLAVEFMVDGQRIADSRVDVPAGGSATVSASHRFASAGDHVVEVHVADDSLPVDNYRWLSVSVREAIQVLAVGSRPSDTRHIALALNPRPQDGGAVAVKEVSDSVLAEMDLDPFDCILLSNIGRFSRDEAGLLHHYVTAGGGLIFFLGDQVQVESYNEQLADTDDRQRILPAHLSQLAKNSSYRFNPLNYEHAIISSFRGHESSGLLSTPVWRYIRLQPFPGAKTVLAFDSGDTALVEEKIGRGRSVLFASAGSSESLDRSTDPPMPWTAFSSWPSFPPLLHEIVRWSLSGRDEGRNVEVGAELINLVPSALPDEQALVTLPDGGVERLPLTWEGREARWTMPETDTSGIYTATVGDRPARRFAVNLNAGEGDLSRLDPELLPSQFSRDVRSHEDPVSVLSPGAGAGSYFRTLLAILLMLVLVEPCLAWFFGRGRG